MYPEITWTLFIIAFAVMLATSLVMMILQRSFYTNDPVIKSFSILDLQLAGTENEMDNTITGIRNMGADSIKIFRSLRNHLLVDFIFMPAAYGAIFIACMRVAGKMEQFAG